MLPVMRALSAEHAQRERAAITPKISPQQVDEFRRVGFLVVPDFTTPDDVRSIRDTLMALYDRYGVLPPEHTVDLGDHGWHHGTPQIPEINWATRLAPDLLRAVAMRRGRTIAAQLLGRPVESTGYDHAILKPARNGRDTPWHQDEAYTDDRGPFGSVHFWIPLQDVSLEMGCMEFIPGSHLGPVLPHHPRGHRTTAHVLEVDGVDASSAVACPLPAGGATMHLPRTLHRTGPNRTDRQRLAWILEFGPPSRARWRRWLKPR
jgi:ectoine hydroxylase-related dioxygenase (phytanoyl-CoA dioxygenase family)